jgi:hypothetical protein
MPFVKPPLAVVLFARCGVIATCPTQSLRGL